MDNNGTKDQEMDGDELLIYGSDDYDSSSSSSSQSSFTFMSNGNEGNSSGPLFWIEQQIRKGLNPRYFPEGISDYALWQIIDSMLSEPPKRDRLSHINSLDDVTRLIKESKKIIVLTGAGVSVSCGIPDFRSRDGIYARLAVDFPSLPDPQSMFDIHYFRKDPRPFFRFAREIYPGQYTPSLCHRFIRLLEVHNKLLRNYTQNIDTLEQVAGIKHVIQCHGSFATATCQRCSLKVNCDVIKEDIFSQRIPKCSTCSSEERSSETCALNSSEGSQSIFNQNHDVMSAAFTDSTPLEPIMKPDIVFFGEGLSNEFHDGMAEDKNECDLLIVIGSSLKVRPVALIPSSIPPNVPQILINREPLDHMTFDVELLGNCDVIVSELCHRLGDGWTELNIGEALTEIYDIPPPHSDRNSGKSFENDNSSDNIKNDDENMKTNDENMKNDGENMKNNDDNMKNNDENMKTNDENMKNSDDNIKYNDENMKTNDENMKIDDENSKCGWAKINRESISSRLPEKSYLFCGGHRYIFPGAEVYDDLDEDESDPTSSVSGSNIDDVENTLTSIPEATVHPEKNIHTFSLDSSESNNVSLLVNGCERLSQDMIEDKNEDSSPLSSYLSENNSNNIGDEFSSSSSTSFTFSNVQNSCDKLEHISSPHQVDEFHV